MSQINPTSSGSIYAYYTLDDLISDVGSVAIGDVAFIKERVAGYGGDQTIDVVDASTVTVNELNIITGDCNVSFVVRPQGGKYYTYHFGITSKLSESESTLAVNTAIEWLDGRTLHVPENDPIKYRGAITHPVCSILGAKMPVPTEDYGALKDGAFFVGSMEINSPTINFQSIGVDAGVDNNPLIAADAIACHVNVINTGESVTMIDVIGLGRHPDDPFHAILVAGYKNAIINRVHGIRTYYGFVFKGTNSNIGSVINTENGSMGTIIKSDNLRGDAGLINIGSINVDGKGVAGMGVDIEAVGNSVSCVNIGKVVVKDAVKAFRVHSNGVNESTAASIDVGQITGKGMSGDAISTAGEGTVLGLSIGQVILQDISGRAANFAIGSHLHVKSFIASASDANTYYASDFMRIDEGVTRTQLDQISLLDQWGDVGEGVIRYLNERGNNKLGTYDATFTGPGAPKPINTSFAVVPEPFKMYKVSKVRCKSNAASDIFTIDAANTEVDWTIFIHNDTGASLAMKMLGSTKISTLADGEKHLYRYDGERLVQQTTYPELSALDAAAA